MQYFLKKMAKTIDKHVLIVVSLLHQTINQKQKNMKTQIFKNEKSGAAIYEMNGVILYETVNSTSNCFDLNNEADFREFIKDVIIGGGYMDGLVKTIREDEVGGCSFDDAVIFFNETIKPLI